MNSMTLTCGVTLHLQAVQETILQDLMLEFGDMALVRQPERILQLTGERQVRALAATGKLFTYCAGWGVTTDPPDEANELMELLGRDTAADKPRLRRADWIRTITTQPERGELIGRVMTLTFKKAAPAVAETAVSGFRYLLDFLCRGSYYCEWIDTHPLSQILLYEPRQRLIFLT